MISFDQEASQTFRPVLEPGEKLVWAGRPSGLTFDWAFGWTMILMIILSVVVIGVFAWIVSVEELEPDNAFMLIFGAVAAIGVFHGAIKDSLRFVSPLREHYALTNRRVLIRSGLIRPRIHARPLPDLPGQIAKGQTLDFGGRPLQDRQRGEILRYRFLGIENAQAVEQIFHQQLNRIKLK